MADEGLHGSEEGYRLLFENNPMPMWVYDQQTLRVLAVNELAICQYGYSRAEFLGLSIKDLGPPEDVPALVSYLSEASTGFRAPKQWRLRKKTGTIIDVEIVSDPFMFSGRPARLVLAKDITDQLKLEKELLVLSQAVEQSPSSIVITDTDGNIEYVNPRFTQLTGYSLEEVKGKNTRILKGGETTLAVYQQLWETILSGREWHGEFHNRKKNAEFYWESASISPVRNAQGVTTHFLAVKEDITQRKLAAAALKESASRLEETLAELRSTQRQIVEQERLRAVGQMASGIAHDFNNALTSILGFSELLIMRPESLNDQIKVMSYLKTINTAAKDAAKVVSRLREFYRWREDGELFLPLDLNSLVTHAISLTQPRWKDQALAGGVTIHMKSHLARASLITGNEAQLLQLLTNLILNAVDSMPRGGSIDIRTLADDDYVVLEVGDTGIGMTDEVRQRCLEPFFSTKGEHGTGLGLSIVYGIVQRHEGTIAIETEPGKGATFSIRFPAQRQAAAAPPEAAGRDQEPPVGPSLRILVVDDEPLVIDIVSEYLTGDGHSVETATNGREAFEKFRAGKFDLVLTDRGMPEMNGDQLAAAIKQIAPQQPVILITGFGDIMNAAGEKPDGVDLILGKPITLNQLRQAVATAATMLG